MVNEMNKLRNQLILFPVAITMGALLWMADSMTAISAEKNGYDFPNSGIATVICPSYVEPSDEDVREEKKEEKLNINEKFDKEKERMMNQLVMANVSDTLNVRSEAKEDASKVGFLYKDCGGTIIEQADGWTKIQSGALSGWCSDEFLIFGDEAVAMSDDVGHWLVTIDSEALNVRKEPDSSSEIIGVLAKTDYADFIEIINDKWVSVDFEGDVGYLDTDFIDISFNIDTGETIEQVNARRKIEEELRKQAAEEAQKEKAKEAMEKAKKNLGNLTQNRGAVSADADELRLLAALIYCEAGNQSYEGMIGVGAVVMNRVKSPAYPNTIYSVIYASGQFTPAMSGKVARVYESGPPERCYQAAAASLMGETTVGGATHFRRNNGHAGIVIGAHVFW